MMRPLIFHWALVAFLASYSQATDKLRNFKYARARYDQSSLFFSSFLMKEYPFLEKLNQTTIYNGSTPVSFYENDDVMLDFLTEDEMILQVIHKVYVSRTANFIFNYDKPEDKLRASDPKLVDDARCSLELNYLKQQLNRNTFEDDIVRGITPEAAAFFDSFGSQESSLYLGNINWLGDYRECKNRHIIDTFGSLTKDQKMVSIKGRYCIASIASNNWEHLIDNRLKQLKEKGYFKRKYQDVEYRNFMSINLGVCLPESCDSRLIDRAEHFDDLSALVKHKLNKPFNSYKLVNLYCLPDDGSELRKPELGALVYMSISAIWLSLILLATLMDYFKFIDLDSSEMRERHMRDCSVFERLVSSLSTIRCFKSLKKSSRFTGNALASLEGREEFPTGSEEKLYANDLYFLHLFKLALLACVLLGHVGMITFWLGLTPLEENQSNFIISLFMAFTLNVDWYFVITGFTVSYLMMRGGSMRVLSAGKWLYMIFHRYCRLAPVYLMLFWSARTVGHLMGSGPLWDYRTSNSSHVNLCRNQSLLITHSLSINFHSLFDECIGPAWYIANDFQFAIITPPLLYLLQKNFRATYVGSLVAVMVSCTMLFLRIMNDPRLEPFKLIYPRGEVLMHIIWDFDSIYLYPWFRVGPFLMGALAGHYCFMVRSGRWQSSLITTNNKIQLIGTGRRAALAWLGVIMAILTNLSPYINELLASRISSVEEARRKASMGFLFHTISAVGPTLLIVALVLGHWSNFRRFAEHSLFGYLSSLNYFVYLGQIEIMSWLIGTSNRAPERSMHDNLLLFLSSLCILYLMSIPVTLFLSQPICRLERAFVSVYATPAAGRNRDLTSEEARERRQQAKQLVEINGQ